MAVNNCNSLVLSGVSVVRDVVTGTKSMGCVTVNHETLATHLHLRHVSQCYPCAVQETQPRQDVADFLGGADAAARAGRPGGTPGSRASRSPARHAGGTISSWSPARVAWRPSLTALRLSQRLGLPAGGSSISSMSKRDVRPMQRTQPMGDQATRPTAGR